MPTLAEELLKVADLIKAQKRPSRVDVAMELLQRIEDGMTMTEIHEASGISLTSCKEAVVYLMEHELLNRKRTGAKQNGPMFRYYKK